MKLLPHQPAAVDWLLAQRDGRAYLGDAPGFGKTFTIASAVARAGDQQPLVICPAIVRDHWYRTMQAAGVLRPIVRSYEQYVRGLDTAERTPDTLVIDEAHYLKNVSAHRTLALLGKEGPARTAAHVFLASGTPVPRSPDEFGTIFMSCFPHLAREYRIPTLAAFRDRFVITRLRRVRHGQWAPKVVGIKNTELFQEILGRCMLRRTVMEGAPALFWQQVPLSVDQVDDAVREGAVIPPPLHALLDRWRGKPDTDLAALAEDPHIARWRRKVGELKAPAVVEMLKQQLLDGREKVVVFAYHHAVLDALWRGLNAAGIEARQITGDTLQKARDTNKRWFQECVGPAVLLAQNTAVGTGTDGLQVASNRCILVEPSWAQHENVQMAKRLARIGGSPTVTAQMISLAGTLDDFIVAQNQREAEWETRIFGATDG